MKKVMRIGTIPCNGRRASLFCVVQDRKGDGELSFTGVIGPLRSGNALGGCGQIDMEFAHRKASDDDQRYGDLIKASDIRFAPGRTRDKWLDFLDAWKRWHLNHMKAGSKVQEDWLRKHPAHDTDWTQTSKRLRRAGLNPDPDGYKYGSEWKREEVPAEVLAFLQALPDADRSPAWA